MTVMEAINHVDAVKPNGYTQREKIKWLSPLDGVIKKEIIDTHEGGENIIFKGYDESSLLCQLIVEAPYDEVYIRWLEAMIDYANGEYKKYNNTIMMYNNIFRSFTSAYHREHKPINEAKFTNF